MSDWQPLCSVGDIKYFCIATDEHDVRGEMFRFLCFQILHDGRELPVRFKDMDRIAEFTEEFGGEIIFEKNEDAEALGAELDTARRRLRGELH